MLRNNVRGGEVAFTPVEGAAWLVDPLSAGHYIVETYKRRKHINQVGSILPLSIAKIDASEISLRPRNNLFEEVTYTFAAEVMGVGCAALDIVDITPGNASANLSWHVDVASVVARRQTFNFLYTDSDDQSQATRFAPPGSPILPPHLEQPVPADKAIVPGKLDEIVLMPGLLTNHASPATRTPDTVFYNRFTDFSVSRLIDFLP